MHFWSDNIYIKSIIIWRVIIIFVKTFSRILRNYLYLSLYIFFLIVATICHSNININNLLIFFLFSLSVCCRCLALFCYMCASFFVVAFTNVIKLWADRNDEHRKSINDDDVIGRLIDNLVSYINFKLNKLSRFVDLLRSIKSPANGNAHIYRTSSLSQPVSLSHSMKCEITVN